MASTIPTDSCPGTKAKPGCKSPVHCSWSVPHRPQASTRSSPSSSPTSGTASSRPTSRRGASSTIARARLPPPPAAVTPASHGRALRRDPVDRLLGLADDPAHQLTGGHQLVDRADALTRWVELALGVDVLGRLVTAEVVRPVLERANELHREALQLVRVLLEVARVAVGDDAARLAGVRARDHRAVLGQAKQRVLVARRGARLGRR